MIRESLLQIQVSGNFDLSLGAKPGFEEKDGDGGGRTAAELKAISGTIPGPPKPLNTPGAPGRARNPEAKITNSNIKKEL